MALAGLALLAHGTAGPVASGAIVDIEIRDSQFRPAVIRIGSNDTVVWRNLGPSVHRIVASNGAFDSGPLSVGQRYAFTFVGQTDDIQYACGDHGNQAGHEMQGTLLFPDPRDLPDLVMPPSER